MSYALKLPSAAYGGAGSIGTVNDIISASGAKKILICTDKGVAKTGLLGKLLEVLGNCGGLETQIVDTLAAEPSYAQVEANLALVEGRPELIIALGGGSVMDAAKLFSILIGADYTIRSLLDNPAIAVKHVKTVMIPTTCGTGSEATCNAIVAVPEKSVKVGIVSAAMIPDYVILDPEMIRRLPKSIVAATGVDALAHAVECFTSNKATAFSDVFARESARLIFGNILKAYNEPDNMDAKEAMMMGAYFGGIAITASGTTAVHALSYPLGGKFHIAHGVSNAILFAPVMRVNCSACSDRLAQLCDAVYPELLPKGAQEKAAYMISRIEEVVKGTNIPTDLSEYGVTRADLDFLIEAGSQQKRLLNNNRKELTLDEIRGIYEEVLK